MIDQLIPRAEVDALIAAAYEDVAQHLGEVIAEHNKTHHNEELEGWLSGLAIWCRSRTPADAQNARRSSATAPDGIKWA